MQKPPVLKADMQKCQEKGSIEALGSGIRSDSLFPTVRLRRFRFGESQKERQSSDHSVRKYLETNCDVSIRMCCVSPAQWKVPCLLYTSSLKITIVLFSSVLGSVRRKEWSAIMENFVGADHRKLEQKIHT